MLNALTRAVSPTIVRCQLTYLQREEINVSKAIREQQSYERCLAELGVHVISLPKWEPFPDSVFIEDTAIVLDEVAIIASMGALTRRREVSSTADALSNYRPLKFIRPGGTLEGGDVVQIGRRLYVGVSTRTNCAGIDQLRNIVRPYDYDVIDLKAHRCLHLTTGFTYIGQNTVLANRNWVCARDILDVEIIDVHPTEPWAANALLVGDVVVMSKSYPQTRALLEDRGFKVKVIDISELEKAEAGLTCLSIFFQAEPNRKK